MANSNLGTISSRSPRDRIRCRDPRRERSNTAYEAGRKPMDYRLCHSRGSVRYSGQRGRLRERPEPRLSIEFATRSPRARVPYDRRRDERTRDYTQVRSVPKYLLCLTVTNRALPAAARYDCLMLRSELRPSSRPGSPSSVPPSPDPLHRLARHAAQSSAPERQTEGEAKAQTHNRKPREPATATVGSAALWSSLMSDV